MRDIEKEIEDVEADIARVKKQCAELNELLPYLKEKHDRQRDEIVDDLLKKRAELVAELFSIHEA